MVAPARGEGDARLIIGAVAQGGGARNGSRGEEDTDPAESDVAAGHWSR